MYIIIIIIIQIFNYWFYMWFYLFNSQYGRQLIGCLRVDRLTVMRWAVNITFVY